MEITRDPQFRQELLQMIHNREFSERTGVHCTSLLYCLNKALLRERVPENLSENSLLLFSLGWSTQRWLTGKGEDEPEKEVDGIKVTLDALRNGVPWELKATFKSSERVIEEELSWLRQIMCQCKVTGTTSASLSRLEICGNWKSIFGKKEDKALPENQKPTLSAWSLTFSQTEIDANWEWMKERRDIYLQALAEGELLSQGVALPIGHAWECDEKYCEFKGKECTCS